MTKTTAPAFQLTGDTILAGAQAAARKESRMKITQEHKDQAADLMGMVVAAELKKEQRETKKAKRSKGKAHDQRGKDNGERARDAAPVAEAIIEQAKATVAADHAIGHRIKELRDGGMAWWQIGYELGLPGSGPNVASGKGGASRARTLYKKTFGALPGGTVVRSTKARRAQAAAEGAAPVVRKPLFSPEELGDAEGILARVLGHEIRWIGRAQCADGSTIETEREARVHPEGASIAAAALPGGPVLHFRETDKGDRRAQQYRSVRLADVFDIRR